MKTMCPPVYHHNGFVATHALGDMIYIYIYIWYSFWAKVFQFDIESWPEWDSNPQPRAYHAHALTTELSGRTVRCA